MTSQPLTSHDDSPKKRSGKVPGNTPVGFYRQVHVMFPVPTPKSLQHLLLRIVGEEKHENAVGFYRQVHVIFPLPTPKRLQHLLLRIVGKKKRKRIGLLLSGSCHFSSTNTKVTTTSPTKDCRQEKKRKRSGLLSSGSCRFSCSNTKVATTSPIKDFRQEKNDAVGLYRQVHVIFPFQHQSAYKITHYHTKTKDALDLQQA